MVMRQFFSEPWGAAVIGAAILGVVVFFWLVASNTDAARATIERMEADVRAREACGPGVEPLFQNGGVAVWPCP